MTTPIPPVPPQIQDSRSGSRSASANTPTSSYTVPTLPGHGGGPERLGSIANMTTMAAATAAPSLGTTMVFDSASPGGGGGGGGGTTQTVGPKAVKRPRPVKSCNSCRQRKLRCDRSCPCAQCLKSGRSCQYVATDSESAAATATAAHGGGSEGSDAETSPRPVKRQYRASQTSHASASGGLNHSEEFFARNSSSSSSAAIMEQFGARLERLERLVLANNTHNNNNNNYQNSHSGMENTNNHHSPYAPSWHSATPRDLHSGHGSVTGAPMTIRGLSVKGNNLRTRFFGQNSSRVLLNLFDEAREFLFTNSSGGSSDGIHDLFVQLHKIYKTISEDHRRALTPISVFTDSLLPVQKRMADILPNKAICDRLLDVYITVSEGLYRVVHVPSFRAEYDVFWQWHQQQQQQHQPQRSPVSETFLPRLLCMLSLGARFDTEKRGLSHDRADGIHAPTACVLARAWLDSLRGKQLVDLEILQCEILLLHATRMLSSRNQESWAQLGSIVRKSMIMGLHRDPDEFPQLQRRPFHGELRRRLWYTVLDMDLHVALACNMPCAVREEGEFTCRPPRNIEDRDLHPDLRELPPTQPFDAPPKPAQLQAYASRTLPHRLRVASLLGRLDTLRDFEEVLACGTELERLLDQIHNLFPRTTKQKASSTEEWRQRALLDLHVRRSLLALYRPFALSTVACPSRITESYLTSSMVMLTYLDELDPGMVGFADIREMYYVVMRHDLLQAAFSVCYFIQAARAEQKHDKTRAGTSNGQLSMGVLPQHHDSRGHDDDADDAARSSNGSAWSIQDMTRAVFNALESFSSMVTDSSCDLKDTVVLSVVLNSVLGGGVDERAKRIHEGLGKIVDKCSAALGTSVEGFAGISMSGPTTPMDPYAPRVTPPTPQQHQQYGPSTFFEDFSLHDMDQWDVSSMPMGMNMN